ncbi:LacI family DNA-binding transcriptional regulator [Sporolactobacillus nakayamae]|uniref:Transcriptional regulator, LacI family n=1 Tax=Sporolactobacillus nakayamae TaxID=269670 RepID=A0A1I2TSG4_9BACL|nr:LacI family DNA-binding transcriptional regulator [Sporolactobacillus nakayamae]SFG67808.1 transcriptional regulator, LacI family [Sporolactobacillus nakayamae]
MATLSDVAKKAVVSKMTVSRVINHPEQVSDELRKLVYNAMKELKYVPNYAARALVQNRTQVVKLLILEEMDTTEPYYMNLLAGIAIELDQHHYSLQLVTRNSHTIGKCDGVIVTGMRREDFAHIIAQLDQPVVLFGQNEQGYDYIDVDNRKGMQMATEHVLSLGCKHILFYGIDINEPFMASRLEGFKRSMEHVHLKPQICLMKNSSHVAQFEAEKILRSTERRTVFVCASDRLGIGVVRAAQCLGLNVPGDVAVTGFDGVFLDRISHPQLTTIRQPIVEMGKALVSLLLEKINQNGKKVGHRIFEPELIVRGSTIQSVQTLPKESKLLGMN